MESDSSRSPFRRKYSIACDLERRMEPSILESMDSSSEPSMLIAIFSFIAMSQADFVVFVLFFENGG